MNGQQALRSDQGFGGEGAFHGAPGHLVGAPPSEPPPSSARSEAPTMAYTDPFAETMAAPFSDRGSQDWCVDLGAVMRTMTTFELWQAIERAEVLASMRVWREGMECWTPISNLPDFALALAGAAAPPAEATTGPAPRAEPLPVALTPAPSAITTPPPASQVRASRFAGARWIGLGSAVALSAIASAMFVPGASVPMPAAPPPADVAVQGSPVIGAASDAEDRAQPAVDERPAEASPRHVERGQRRLSRNGRRAAQGR